MNKLILILSGLLLGQLVLALAVNLTGEDYAAYQAQEPLLSFDRQAVDAVEIASASGSLRLKKEQGRWLLPDLGDFPAKAETIERLLDRIASMKKGWPVATSGGAIERFKVSEDQFERKLELSSGGKTLAQLYLGTSPGFRKAHARPADENRVFAVEFNSWEANVKPDDWIDQAILNLEPDQVQRIEMADLILERQEQTLKLANLELGQTADQERINTWVDKLLNLNIQSLLGVESKPEYRQQQPEFEIKLQTTEGELLTYRFSKPEEGAYYVLKRSDQDQHFKVADYSVAPIRELTPAQLLASAEPVSGDSVPPQSETGVSDASAIGAPPEFDAGTGENLSH